MKYFLKCLLLPVLTSHHITRLATRFFGCGIPVFMLHRMVHASNSGSGRISPSHLRRCLQYLVNNGYTFISLEHLVLALNNKQVLPPKAVVFTMDDGFADQAEIAVPVFLEFECPLTFFVITGMLDKTIWPWDAQVSWIIEASEKTLLETSIVGKDLRLELGSMGSKRLARRLIQDVIRENNVELLPGILKKLARDAEVTVPETAPAQYLPMSWDMARQLESMGVQFAPHSVSHNVLSRLSKESLEKEIHDSWQIMEEKLVNPLKVFCYPTGRTIDFGSREIETLKRNGFLGAVTTTPGYVEAEKNPEQQIFNLPRFALPESINDFIQYCTWIEYAKSKPSLSIILDSLQSTGNNSI